jgi:hypothetical protein
MADKVQALVEGELERVPAQLKPFIQEGEKDDPDQIFMTLGYMAYAIVVPSPISLRARWMIGLRRIMSYSPWSIWRVTRWNCI